MKGVDHRGWLCWRIIGDRVLVGDGKVKVGEVVVRSVGDIG